jgi:mono/diheme cytochrome c family protein
MKRFILCMALLALAACGEGEMSNQPKYKPYRPANLFPNRMSSQSPPDGVVARGEPAAAAASAQRPTMTAALLARGQERFEIYCAPCHGRDGTGNGLIPQRGFPHPPSYHEDRLRAASDRYLVNVIANGYGAMFSYGARVSPPDRWAIVAYIRALQLSRNVPERDVTGAARQDLAAAP